MSQENVETLRRALDLLWREGKIEEALESTSRDIEWVGVHAPDGLLVRQGREALASFFRDWLDVFETLDVSYEFREVDEDRVAVLSRYRARAKASGVVTEMRLGQVWTMRDGMAVRCENYATPAEALEAAGLRE
jgi:ketosteroid isomerase-like protein